MENGEKRNRRHIWICDADNYYLNMMQGYLRSNLGLPLHISDFTDPVYMEDARHKEAVAILIISQELYARIDPDEYPAVLVLTEGDEAEPFEAESSHVRSICRYVRTADIVKLLLEMISEMEGIRELCMGREMNVHIIGFYSPLGRCLQSKCALALGEILSERADTCYMDFAAFPAGESRLSARDGNLSDLIYYYACAPASLPVRFSQIARQLGRLKVIPPAPSYLQTADLQPEQWMSFIRELCKVSGCEYLVLDLSEALPCLFEMMELSEHIYTICGHDAYDAAKIASYKNWMGAGAYAHLMARTTFLQLPGELRLPQSDEMLAQSQLGEYLRRGGFVPAYSKECGSYAACGA